MRFSLRMLSNNFFKHIKSMELPMKSRINVRKSSLIELEILVVLLALEKQSNEVSIDGR